MDDPAYDYSDYAAPEGAVGNNLAATLHGLIQEQLDAENSVTAAEAALDEAKRRLLHIKGKVLPELLDELQLPEFKLPNGTRVVVKEDLRATLPKEGDAKRPQAFGWLEDNGLGGAIKFKVELSLPAGAEAKVLEAVEALKRAGLPAPKIKKDIHNQTLCAALREKVSRGVAPPLEELFNGFRQRVTHITRSE